MLRPRQRDFAQLGPEVFQHRQRLRERAADFRMHPLRPRHFRHDPEPQPFHAGFQLRRIIRHRTAAAERVVRVETGDRLEEQRVVLDRARDRPYGVRRPAVHDAAVATHSAEGRSQTHDAARRSRTAHGAAGVFAQRTRTKAGRGRNAGTAR
ncbi:hypothetical protein D3C83_08990 [compost metagenome]